MIEEKQGKVLRIIMAAILLVSMYFVAGEGAAYVNSGKVTEGRGAGEGSKDIKERELCVVIDAGHGGADPGKVGVNGSLEKDINLKIAEKVKKFLELDGVKVIMTRTDDNGLYDEGASNKKVQDMKRRIAVIEEAHPQIVVSIHQNSYHEEYVNGAQVFYYGTSQEGQRLAETLQEKLVSYVDPENHRQAKANESYYLLKKTEVPIVIVECGFLSNWEEAKKLQEDSYQNQIAWAVSMGILSYLEEGAE